MYSNINKLNEGQFIKNYKEMCKLLDLEVKGGKGKIYQMRDIERHLKLEKPGYGFWVREIYVEPLPKIDGRANNGGNISNTKYDDLMDKLIINLLIDYDGTIEESYSSLMNNYFDFFTAEYKKLYNMGYRRYSEVNRMGKGVVMTYQQKIKDVVETCLETALKRLKRNGIIEYADNKVVLDKKFVRNYADAKFLKKIKNVEQKVYKEMGITSFDRGDPRKNRQFKNKVCNYLEINNYWNVYTFELVDKTTKRVEEDSDELIRRFIKSVEENTKNTNIKDDDGDKYKPYSYDKYEGSIDKLTKLIWKLPEGYSTEYELKQLLIGKVEDVENRYEEYEQTQTNYEVPF